MKRKLVTFETLYVYDLLFNKIIYVNNLYLTNNSYVIQSDKFTLYKLFHTLFVSTTVISSSSVYSIVFIIKYSCVLKGIENVFRLFTSLDNLLYEFLRLDKIKKINRLFKLYVSVICLIKTVEVLKYL